MEKKYKFETQAIRIQSKRTHNREHAVPIYMTSSFTFENAEQGAAIFQGKEEGNLYSRFSNPNTSEFIEKLCALEGCDSGIATASGMAAVYTSLVANLSQGDHVLASNDIFGNSLYIITQILPKMGVEYTLVDIDDNESWEKSVKKNTKILYLETPSNPTLKMGDLSFLGRLSSANELIFIVDNCFATPYLQQPTKFGVDLIIHSATKYIDGQGRVLGGAIVGNENLVSICYDFVRRTGASLSPFNAWVLSKSLETLSIRMDRHCDNALKIAKFLEESALANNVVYPHLDSYPQIELSKKQMKYGGGLVAFELGGGIDSGIKFLNNLKLHSLTANLGDCRSIATHPASTTHSKLTNEEQLAMGITPGFIRLSVGLEHIDDLIYDIHQSLNQL
ncbi:MAG: PLP-dependent transferase [Saprospiraceae bacterium]